MIEKKAGGGINMRGTAREAGAWKEAEGRIRLREIWNGWWRKGLIMRKERDGRRRNGFKWRTETSMQELGKDKV
jgi:hypothetical protein